MERRASVRERRESATHAERNVGRCAADAPGCSRREASTPPIRIPPRLSALDPSLASLTARGRLEPAIAVAIVGTRTPCEPARAFAHELAGTCAATGALVVSGGARGIDAAAHEGALAAGGRTWAVLPTGCDHVYPAEHASLFDAIVEGGGALLWPFPPSQPARRHLFFARNRVLVALADAVVVVQAGIPSGALNAAMHARRLGKRLWVACPPAWATQGFEGSCALLDQGATPLTSPRPLLASLRLAPPRPLPSADFGPRARQSDLYRKRSGWDLCRPSGPRGDGNHSDSRGGTHGPVRPTGRGCQHGALDSY